MTYREHLVRKIEQHLEKGEPLPVDLITDAMAEGLDVSAIEENFEPME